MALLRNSERGPAPPERVAAATAPVTTGRVTVETSAVGTLAYPARGPVTAGAAGVVTWLPKTGSVLGRGDVLYTVDARPAMLLHGELPAYRTFEKGMSDGDDVLQLETNLAALGYFRGDIDRHFSAWTVAAVKRWQRALGVWASGRLDPSAVVFSPQRLRVARRRTRLGTVVGQGAELYATSADPAGRARRPAPRRPAARPGGSARDGGAAGRRRRPRRVTSVGAPQQRRSDRGTSVVVPVVVGLRVPRAAAAFVQATVTVRFRSASRRDVLTVPVGALVALGGDRFGVEVPTGATTRRVPVRVGEFEGGRVEITGTGIAPGVRAGVPSS